MLIYGINPVLEALRARRVTAMRVSPRADDASDATSSRLAERAGRGGPARRAGELDRAARGGVHQGVVAERARARERSSVEDLVAGAPGAPLIVVLDGIEDPHNVGAILRTVDAAGADGVVRQSRHAAPLDGAAAKASAGAVSHVKIAEVVNIARALEELKDGGRLDGRARGRRAEALRRGRSRRCRRRSWSGRRARGCGGWSGSGATGWCRFRCAGMSRA